MRYRHPERLLAYDSFQTLARLSRQPFRISETWQACLARKHARARRDRTGESAAADLIDARDAQESPIHERDLDLRERIEPLRFAKSTLQAPVRPRHGGYDPRAGILREPLQQRWQVIGGGVREEGDHCGDRRRVHAHSVTRTRRRPRTNPGPSSDAGC